MANHWNIREKWGNNNFLPMSAFLWAMTVQSCHLLAGRPVQRADRTAIPLSLRLTPGHPKQSDAEMRCGCHLERPTNRDEDGIQLGCQCSARRKARGTSVARRACVNGHVVAPTRHKAPKGTVWSDSWVNAVKLTGWISAIECKLDSELSRNTK